MVLIIGETLPVFWEVIIGVLTFLMGIAVFSYLNRVIEILPEGIEEEEEETLRIEEDKKDKDKYKAERDALKQKIKERRKDKWLRLTRGRSVCPMCNHPLKLKETIPVFSWLFGKKECAYCFKKISIRHTLIELMGGFLAVAPLVYYGLSVEWLTIFLLYCILAVIAIIDFDTQYIPPELNILLGILGCISMVTLPGPTIAERLIGVVCVSIPLLVITLIVPGAFGGGDIKMMAAIGLLLGFKGTVVAFMIGVLFGGGYGVYVLVSKKMSRKEHFAFGPFLAVGIAIAAYAGCGASIMTTYVNYLMESFQPY